MINTLKDKLHQLAIRKQWYNTVYTGKITIHKTIFGRFFTAINYTACPLNRLIRSEVDKCIIAAKVELLEDLESQKERARIGSVCDRQLEAVQDFTKLDIKGILPD